MQTFKKLNLYNYKLLNTPSGHPAIPITPAKAVSAAPVLQVEDIRLQPKEQYMSVYAVAHRPLSNPQYTGIYHEKKLDPSVRDVLSQDCLQLDTFMTWWQQTTCDKDFWLETPAAWIRVHVVPRRAMFNPMSWRTTVEGVEGGQYLRSFFETIEAGELISVDRARSPLLCLSDCRSLYDHIHKEGVPRVPTDRRLAIDLAALRQALRAEQWSTSSR